MAAVFSLHCGSIAARQNAKSLLRPTANRYYSAAAWTTLAGMAQGVELA
jgi:hypothetical protein